MIAILDYGAGNLHSVEKALRHLGREDLCITSDPAVLQQADAAILPGVGAFGHAMEQLHQLKLVEPIQKFIAEDKPFLGICLGLQLLFEKSEESPGVAGLGVLKGELRQIPKEYFCDLKIPHMGWNSLTLQKGALYTDISPESYVYFVHSYYLTAEDRDIVTAQTDYVVQIDASIQRGNLFATQFHPEKSGEVGLAMLQNFLNVVAEQEGK